jgi:RecA/RadA recombinase
VISNRVTGIIGPKGSGKTFRAARLFGAEDRALFYQPARMNSECDVFATHVSCGDMEGVRRVLEQEEQFRIVYKVPDSDFVRRGQNLFYASILPLAQLCYDVGNMTMYIDEAHEICNQYTIDPELRRVIRLARNNQLNLVWVSQSMEVHREIRRNTDEFYFYRIFEPGDLDKIAERCGDLTAQRVSNLKRLRSENGAIVPGECIVWTAEEA